MLLPVPRGAVEDRTKFDGYVLGGEEREVGAGAGVSVAMGAPPRREGESWGNSLGGGWYDVAISLRTCWFRRRFTTLCSIGYRTRSSDHYPCGFE